MSDEQVEQYVRDLEKKVDGLERDNRGTQEMLFLVLLAVDETVKVPTGQTIEGDKMIDISLNAEDGVWEFSVKDVPSEL